MSEVPPPEFWANQNRLDELVPAIEALAISDPDHLLVGVNARRNSILVVRRAVTTPHAQLEPTYRAVLPNDVGLEFVDSVISGGESRLIRSTVHMHRQRLARRCIHVTQVGALAAGGPVEVRYWAPSTELTFDLLVEVRVTKRWPEDLVRRRPVNLRRVERTPAWGRRRAPSS